MKWMKGWMEIVDDFGSHKYHVLKVDNGCYYFQEKTIDGNKLRYNENEGRIEEYLEDKDTWDVFSAYVYQVDFLANN